MLITQHSAPGARRCQDNSRFATATFTIPDMAPPLVPAGVIPFDHAAWLAEQQSDEHLKRCTRIRNKARARRFQALQLEGRLA